MKLKRYLLVVKPGIIFGNLIAMVGGYFLAAHGNVEPILLLAMVIGLSLVVASGCVLNNCIDHDIDQYMERTCGRVTAIGQISLKAALARGLVLGVIGFGLLWWRTNPPTTALTGFDYSVYVGLYSLWFKRRSRYGALVGSLSGAVPPVVGYYAVSGQSDAGAASLLATFYLWQMSHSYAIAILRLKDYEAAGIPVLPVARGIAVTKIHTALYILAFMAVTFASCLGGYVGYGYLLVTVAVSLWWLVIILTGYWTADGRVWACKLFVFSTVAIAALGVMTSIDFQVAPAIHLVVSLF